jgi:hypothetical protein
MANGKASAGVELDEADPLDDGTSALIPSPSPGPIGLDAPGGSGGHHGASIGQQVVTYARGQHGHRVGDGQCFALADRALRNANARSAADYGTVTREADYQWGTSVTLAELQPGDVIQFRDYVFQRVTVTTDSSGTTREEESGDRPHHTAIVERVNGNGDVTVLEQNIPDGGPVRRTHLFFTAGTTTSGNRTVTITVQGTFRFYRPQPR